MEDIATLNLCIATIILAADALALLEAEKKKSRRCWVRPWMARKSKKVFTNLMKELSLGNEQGFYDYHRVSRKNFANLLELVSPLIKKQDTKMRDAVSPTQRLSITLRYLTTG